MSIVNKPDYKVFAQDAKSGEIETFPDVLRGWGITLDRTAGKPPLEWFNSAGKRVDEWLMYLSQRGLAEWDSTVDYPQYAVVQQSGKFYVAINENREQQPDHSQSAWKLMSDFLGAPKSVLDALNTKQEKGDYATNSALKTVNDNANSRLAKNQNGADIPDKNAFVKNLGLSETVNKANNALPISSTLNAQTGNLRINNSSNWPHLEFEAANKQLIGIEATLSSLFTIYANDAAGKRRYTLITPEKGGTLATTDDINVPVGVPVPYPHRYTPPGYLTCNGQSFDKSLYPKLAEAYPAGKVPDLRGEFIRGWDDSRGVDPGRVCGTTQGDAIRNITGRLDVRLDGSFSIVDAASGSFTKTRDTSSGLYCLQEANYARGADNVTFDASRVVPTANENRPRNVAFNYIVRAA
ncbi:phage tail protein [Photorhabdus luminescens]|uniref:phage tail protein n=1 Tax=Photorhabdus luminescens TaxID=29488 RepID=UPI000B4CB045|nr:phage tail protein [Photorhabdus luminescens]OWO79305.1 phage tail protein [Photorhabdus luminescens]